MLIQVATFFLKNKLLPSMKKLGIRTSCYTTLISSSIRKPKKGAKTSINILSHAIQNCLSLYKRQMCSSMVDEMNKGTESKHINLPMVGNPNLLRSRLFLLGIVVLVLNDHYLKLAYPNWLTGKISDFAGLFVLPIFLSALFERATALNYVLTALMFTLWKSPITEPLLTAGNAIGIPFHRTVDYSDLIALTILPFSYKYLATISPSGATNRTLATNALAVVCFVCLTATSVAPNFGAEINKSYEFKASKSDLINEINQLNCEFYTELSDTGDSLYVIKNLVIENDSIIKRATFWIEHNGDQSVLTLRAIETFHSYPAFFTWGQRRQLRKVAEKYLIKEIR